MSMKDYLQDSQMELFIFSVMTEFMNNEGYKLSEEQQKTVLDKSTGVLKALDYNQLITIDSENKEELKLSIQKLAGFGMHLFSLCIMQAAREEKYKEIINSLKDKNL